MASAERDEQVWQWVMEYAAERAGVSPEEVAAVCARVGWNAQDHRGVSRVVELARAINRPDLPHWVEEARNIQPGH